MTTATLRWCRWHPQPASRLLRDILLQLEEHEREERLRASRLPDAGALLQAAARRKAMRDLTHG